MTLPWIDIAIAAGCALISAIVTKVLMTGFRPNHLFAALIWMVLFPIILVVAFVFVKPEAEAWRARAVASTLIEDEPLLSLMSIRHSEVQDEIHEVMTDAVKRGFSGEEARRMAFSQSAGFLMTYFDTYLKQAGDEEVAAYAAQLLRIAGMIEENSGVRCYWLLTGSPASDGSTFTGVPGVELSDLSLRMSRVILSAINQPREPMTPEAVEVYVEELKRRLGSQLSDELSAYLETLDRPASNDVERRRVCKILLSLFGEAFRMPREQRSQAFRALLIHW